MDHHYFLQQNLIVILMTCDHTMSSHVQNLIILVAKNSEELRLELGKKSIQHVTY